MIRRLALAALAAPVVVQAVVCVINVTVFRGTESKGQNWAELRSGS